MYWVTDAATGGNTISGPYNHYLDALLNCTGPTHEIEFWEK